MTDLPAEPAPAAVSRGRRGGLAAVVAASLAATLGATPPGAVPDRRLPDYGHEPLRISAAARAEFRAEIHFLRVSACLGRLAVFADDHGAAAGRPSVPPTHSSLNPECGPPPKDPRAAARSTAFADSYRRERGRLLAAPAAGAPAPGPPAAPPCTGRRSWLGSETAARSAAGCDPSPRPVAPPGQAEEDVLAQLAEVYLCVARRVELIAALRERALAGAPELGARRQPVLDDRFLRELRLRDALPVNPYHPLDYHPSWSRAFAGGFEFAFFAPGALTLNCQIHGSDEEARRRGLGHPPASLPGEVYADLCADLRFEVSRELQADPTLLADPGAWQRGFRWRRLGRAAPRARRRLDPGRGRPVSENYEVAFEAASQRLRVRCRQHGPAE